MEIITYGILFSFVVYVLLFLFQLLSPHKYLFFLQVVMNVFLGIWWDEFWNKLFGSEIWDITIFVKICQYYSFPIFPYLFVLPRRNLFGSCICFFLVTCFSYVLSQNCWFFVCAFQFGAQFFKFDMWLLIPMPEGTLAVSFLLLCCNLCRLLLLLWVTVHCLFAIFIYVLLKPLQETVSNCWLFFRRFFFSSKHGIWNLSSVVSLLGSFFPVQLLLTKSFE